MGGPRKAGRSSFQASPGCDHRCVAGSLRPPLPLSPPAANRADLPAEERLPAWGPQPPVPEGKEAARERSCPAGEAREQESEQGRRGAAKGSGAPRRPPRERPGSGTLSRPPAPRGSSRGGGAETASEQVQSALAAPLDWRLPRLGSLGSGGAGAVGQPCPRRALGRQSPPRPAPPGERPPPPPPPPRCRSGCRAGSGAAGRMDFDGRVLRQAGGFGRRARFLAAASWLPNVGLALGLAAGLVLAAVPPHRCRPDPALLPAALRNASGPELLNASAPPGSRCLLYRYPLPGAGPGPPNGTGPCTRGWRYALPAAGLRSTPVTQWDLVCAKRWQVPLEQTTHLLGGLAGYVALGAACDRFGRRIIFALSLVLSVPLGFGVALAVDYLMLVMMRMLFGAMLAGGFLSLYVARLELCDPPHRLVVTMSASFFWVAGLLLLPGLAVAVAEWRLLQGAITLGLTLLAACWWSPSLFPESARWLLATQQLQRGKQALLDLARGNGVSLENGSPIGEPLLAEMESWVGGGPRAEYRSICRIFRTRVVWKNSLILGFTAFIGSGIRHSFARNLAPYAPRFYFPYFLLAGSEAVAVLFLCLTVDHFGRRAVLLFGTIVTGVSSLLLLALMQYLMAWLVLALSILGILASQAVAALSIFFASEMLPTVVRGGGLGLILAAHTLGQAATPMMDIQPSRGFFLHHVVFASFAVLSVLSVMLLPETSHRPLPDSMQEGESLHRPPLFHPARHHCRRQDQLPLLSTPMGTSPYDPESYAHLVTATKKMLGSHVGPAGPGGQGSPLCPET